MGQIEIGELGRVLEDGKVCIFIAPHTSCSFNRRLSTIIDFAEYFLKYSVFEKSMVSILNIILFKEPFFGRKFPSSYEVGIAKRFTGAWK